MACPSPTLCVAVSRGGYIATSASPWDAAPQWSAADVDPGNNFTVLACPSVFLCVAVDDAGNAAISSDPTAGAGAWTIASIDSVPLESVACPDASLCIAGDEDGAIVVGRSPHCAPLTIQATQLAPAAVRLDCRDPLHQPVTYQVLAGPFHGALSGSDALLTYRPVAGYAGLDGIVYRATVPDGTFDTEFVRIAVLGHFSGNRSGVSADYVLHASHGRTVKLALRNGNGFPVNIGSLALRAPRGPVSHSRLMTIARLDNPVTIPPVGVLSLALRLLTHPRLQAAFGRGPLNATLTLVARAPDGTKAETHASVRLYLA